MSWGAPLFGTCIALARGDEVLACVVLRPEARAEAARAEAAALAAGKSEEGA